MANIYVRSTDGDNADSGATWATAKATLAGAAAIVAAGDTVWVSQVHSESTAAALDFTWNGTAASPVRILCGNDAAEPPTALATGAIVATTGASSITIRSDLYMYGMQYRAGVGGAGLAPIIIRHSNSTQVYEQCLFDIANTENDSDMTFAFSAGFGELIFQDCGFKFSHSDQRLLASEGPAYFRGGSILSGTTPTTVFDFSVSATIYLDGFDFSNCGSTMNLSDINDNNDLHMRNCTLPASWSGSIDTASPTQYSVCELYNSTISAGAFQYHRASGLGTIDGEYTVVRSSGATDGVRAISWKMTTTADARWNHMTFATTKILRWIDTLGSPMTATVEILHDSITNITNQQIWLEVQYLGTSGSTLSAFIDDSSGDYLSAAADQAASSASWTTTGLTNPNKQKLSVTFTPQEAGFVSAIVHMAMASKTVYVCPKIEIS